MIRVIEMKCPRCDLEEDFASEAALRKHNQSEHEGPGSSLEDEE
jgi:hypothetical protein